MLEDSSIRPLFIDLIEKPLKILEPAPLGVIAICYIVDV
jgi:hypothetical protein